MASTTFVAGTVIPVAWLNEVNALLWGSASPPATPIRVDLSGVASFYSSTNQDGIRINYAVAPTGTNGGALNFYNWNNGAQTINLARIYCQTTSGATGNEAGDLYFFTKPAGSGLISRLRIQDTGNILSTGGLIGYDTGAGGSVTQTTSKATNVTLNKASGQIIMNNASLAAGATVAFGFLNSTISATDVVVVSVGSGVGSSGSYRVQVGSTGAGSCGISLTNISGGALAEAVGINFVVIKGSTS